MINNKLIIHVHVLCWNEEVLIPYFLDHYSFAQKIIVYDNESDDNSIALLNADSRVELKMNRTDGQIRDDGYLEIKNNDWKESRGEADYVIVCDMDEFLYHSHIVNFLSFAAQMGYTIFKPVGYQMLGKPFTKKMGVKLPSRDKTMMFNPNKIEEINYEPGAHECNPVGEIKLWRTDDLKMLHYQWLNLYYVIARYQKYHARLSDINREQDWGAHYLSREAELKTYYGNLVQLAKEIK